MRIFWIFLCSILTLNTLAQNDTVNRIDSKNLKQGYWCKQYPNGKKAYEGWFKDNIPVGTFKRYTEKGDLKVVLNCKPDNTAWATFLMPNGTKIAEGKYIKQKKDSIWVYYNSKGDIAYTEIYQNGEKNGKSKQFYSNGQVYESAPYSNGKLNGTLVQFYRNGLNKSIVNFSNGVQHGEIKVFYTNGNLRIDGVYKDGLKDGEWKFYDNNGKLSNTIIYHEGIPENYNELLDAESKELDSLMQNAGKIQEPNIDQFLNSYH